MSWVHLGLVFALLSLLSTDISQAARVAGRHLGHRHPSYPVWPSPGSLPEATGAVSSVAILNPFPWCYEVLFGAVYSLQLIAETVDVYVDFSDLFENTGAAEFLKSLNTRPVRQYDEIWENYASYQLVIWTDHYGWEFEERRKKGPRDLLDVGYTGKIWLFNHEPNDVLWPMLCECDEGKKWTEDRDYKTKTMQVFGHPQIEWFCIAPHVASTLQGLLDHIGYIKNVHWILPVFPWSNSSRIETPWMSTAFDSKKGFSIQGNPDAHRRNYTGLLQDVAAAPELLRDPRFELDLFAWKQLDPAIVPNAVNSKIVYKHLKFPEFYSEIHKTLGLLLLFPGDRYYISASSSSVATAISAGVPMIVDERFLKVYTFIPPAAVVVSHSSSHAVAMQQLLTLTAEKWTELSSMMALTRELAVLRNVQIFSKAFASQPFHTDAR